LQNRLVRRGAGTARRHRSGRPTSWRSICCGCPGRARPGGRTGGAGPRWSVHRPLSVSAVGAVPVNHRGRRRARVADVGVGRDGGRGLQEAGGRLPALGEGLAEIQGPARRARRSSAEPPALWPLPARCCSAGTTAKAAFSTSAAPPPSLGRQVLRSPACSLRGGTVIRGQAGRSVPGRAARKNWSSRWWNPSW
jgi:hypothetical protein